MCKRVKQLVLSIRLSVCQSECLNLNIDRVKRFPKTDSTLSSIDIVKKSDLCVPHMKQSGSILSAFPAMERR